MGKSVRQEARARALAAQAERRRERQEAEKRRSALGVDVAVALGERDAAVARLEIAAGSALESLVVDNEEAIAAALKADLGRQPFEAWLADVASTEPSAPMGTISMTAAGMLQLSYKATSSRNTTTIASAKSLGACAPAAFSW